MDLLITITQFLFSLSIIVILHECGHYFPAKWFKIKVEKFFLFFDPNIGEWDGSIFSFKKGDTKYGVGWLPLGGYVKISGMVDESFDTDVLNEEPKEWEFRSKPAWQRLIIMVGGVVVNLILGVLLFAMIFSYWGESYVPTENAKYGLVVDQLGEELGLQDEDLVIKVGEKDIDRFESSLVKQEILFNGATDLTVKRKGENVTLNIPEDFMSKISSYENRDASLFTFAFPNEVVEVREDGNAQKAGLMVGDFIIGIENISTPYFAQFARELSSKKSEPVDISVLRNSDTLSLEVMVDDNGKIGYFGNTLNHFIEVESYKYPIGTAFIKGYKKSVKFITDQIKAFGQIFKGKIKAKDSLGSMISIGGMFGTEWNWFRFWNLTATLSILLGFINLLPIPALDGGHVMFLLYEVITRRKPSDRFLEYATMAGFFFLILLMIYALGLDIMRLF